MQPKEKRLCVYCLKEMDAPTKDHIPPKSFFTKEERRQMSREKVQHPTVKSCEPCNGKHFQEGEFHLGFILAIDSGSLEIFKDVSRRLQRDGRRVIEARKRAIRLGPGGPLAFRYDKDEYEKYLIPMALRFTQAFHCYEGFGVGIEMTECFPREHDFIREIVDCWEDKIVKSVGPFSYSYKPDGRFWAFQYHGVYFAYTSCRPIELKKK